MNGIDHPLKQMLMRQMTGQGYPQEPFSSQSKMLSGIPQFSNPIQKMNYIMQAMQNPAQFVREHVSGIPESAFSDPTGNGVLNYMQRNMGVTRQDIMNAENQMQQMANNRY